MSSSTPVLHRAGNRLQGQPSRRTARQAQPPQLCAAGQRLRSYFKHLSVGQVAAEDEADDAANQPRLRRAAERHACAGANGLALARTAGLASRTRGATATLRCASPPICTV